MSLATFSNVQEAVRSFRSGSLAIVYDERTGVGELAVNATFASSSVINFMACEARGIVCLALTPDRCDRLSLPQIPATSGERARAAFTVSIEARVGVDTGISAADRAQTVLAAIRDDAQEGDLVRPGHVFPIRVRDGGTDEYAGPAEAAVDLSRQADLVPASVICQILAADGDVASLDQLCAFAERHDIPLVSVGSVVERCRAFGRRATRIGSWDVDTTAGRCHAIAYICHPGGDACMAFAYGDLSDEPVPVGVRVRCLEAALLRGQRCSCTRELDDVLEEIVEAGAGVVLELTTRRPVCSANGALAEPIVDPTLCGTVAAVLEDLGVSTIQPLRSLSAPEDLFAARNIIVAPSRA